MRLHKRLTYAFVFALIVFFVSMFVNIIPCQTAPVIPNPHYTWNFCNLNPDSNKVIGISRLYLGSTSSLAQTYIMVLVISFILALTVLHFTAKTKKQEK